MSEIDRPLVESLITQLIRALGDDPAREGLVGTPARVARWYDEFFNYDPGNLDSIFGAVQTDQMVVVSGIPVWSLCEHHLLPFHAEISIGYITDGAGVLGLSKFARVAQKFSHSLQIQERLVSQIADEIARLTGTENVAVFAQGVHLCMLMRGIKSPAIMSTSLVRGGFKDNPAAREELMTIVNQAASYKPFS